LLSGLGDLRGKDTATEGTEKMADMASSRKSAAVDEREDVREFES
jgi:hypothetical protein